MIYLNSVNLIINTRELVSATNRAENQQTENTNTPDSLLSFTSQKAL